MSSEQVDAKRPPVEITDWNELVRYVSWIINNVFNIIFNINRHNFYVVIPIKNIKYAWLMKNKTKFVLKIKLNLIQMSK
jgi:hypothetical protein